jgi:Uma2 family endonuclease
MIRMGDNATVRLDLENEVQPDALLRFEEGQSEIGEEGYIEGPPELIVEIAASSAAYDRHVKQRVYRRSGVKEYMAVQIYERRIEWFALREYGYEALEPDGDGRLRSELFPGLWLDTAAFWNGDLARMLASLQEGLASPEHAAFVEQFQVKRQK